MTKEERNKIVEENIALVTFCLKKLNAYNEDYFQEGILELIRCVNCFDKSKGYKFSTYACKNIFLYLKEYIIRDKILKPKRTGIGGQVFAPYCNSFEDPFTNSLDSNLTFADIIEDKDYDIKIEDTNTFLDLSRLVDQGIITKNELDFFIKYYIDQITYSKLAKEFKCSQASISSRAIEIKDKIKEHLSYNS